MKPPIHRPIEGPSGCRIFLEAFTKAATVSVFAGTFAFLVGGDQLRGAGVAMIATPVVFLIAFPYFSRQANRNARPVLPRGLGNPRSGKRPPGNISNSGEAQ